jgi:hypothetical protein
MPYNITISDSTLDNLIKDVLVQNWKDLRYDIKKLLEKQDLQNYELEDLANDRRYFDALTVMLEYYLESSRYLALVTLPDGQPNDRND